VLHNIEVCKPSITRVLPPVLDSIVSGDLRVVPIIAIDFSLGNLTFSRQNCLHSAFDDK